MGTKQNRKASREPEKKFNFRVSEQDLEDLALHAEQYDCDSISEFIRLRCIDDFQHEWSPDPTEEISKTVASLEKRFDKLERILRALMINTANVRGFALALSEVHEPSITQKLKERMKSVQEEQKEFFFGIYPEQRGKE